MCQLQVQVFMNEQTETLTGAIRFLYGPKVIINFKLTLL